MAELTLQALKDMMAKLPKVEPDFNPLRLPRFAGREIYEERPVPKIQVGQLFLSDGTPLLPPKFLVDQNNKWIASFGYRDMLCKDRVFFLGSYGILASPMHAAMIRNLCG